MDSLTCEFAVGGIPFAYISRDFPSAFSILPRSAKSLSVLLLGLIANTYPVFLQGVFINFHLGAIKCIPPIFSATSNPISLAYDGCRDSITRMTSSKQIKLGNPNQFET